MQPSELVAAIDEEITRLEQARALLSGGPEMAHRGRTAGAFTGGTAPRKQRKISAAGRARIAAAQKKRWARIRKAAKRAAAGSSANAAKAGSRPKKRKVVKKSSAAKRTSKKRAVSRRAPGKAAGTPATPAPVPEAIAS